MSAVLTPIGGGDMESPSSAVSWGAVFAGAFVAAALSLLLLALGSGLGLASISPWQNSGASTETLGWSGAAWLAIMQIVSASVGGYLAGRLRTKWVGVHTDEVFFRDTAHGFFVWCVATVLAASFLGSAATSLISGGIKAAASVVGAGAGLAAGAAATASKSGTLGDGVLSGERNYVIDRLFRKAPGNSVGMTKSASGTAGQAEATAGGSRGEIGGIFMAAMKDGQLNQDDRAYVAQTIANETGVSQQEAEKRVDDAMASLKAASDQAREAADKARKAAAYLSIWIAISLLMGAFCASFSATLGGKERDVL